MQEDISLILLDGGQHWPAEGDWTYEDYLRLPEDGRRYEVLRGVLHGTPAPTYDHQFCVVSLTLDLGSFIRKGDLGVLLVAPFDIRDEPGGQADQDADLS